VTGPKIANWFPLLKVIGISVPRPVTDAGEPFVPFRAF
jgi:hypothetical protein